MDELVGDNRLHILGRLQGRRFTEDRMALGNLTLKNAAGTSVTFTKISVIGDTAVYELSGGSELTGTTLVIRQGKAGKGVITGTTQKRTYCSVRGRVWNATLGKPVPYTLNATLQGVVDGTSVTAAIVADLIGNLRELLATYQSNLIAGEL